MLILCFLYLSSSPNYSWIWARGQRKWRINLGYLTCNMYTWAYVLIVLFVRSNTGGWSKQDHFHFVHLMEQYPAELPNRRMLYMDRMLREMPHKTRTKLVNLNLMTLAGLTSYQQITGTTFIWFHQMTNPLLVYFMILLSHFCRFCYV